jgi:hypothetical protein
VESSGIVKGETMPIFGDTDDLQGTDAATLAPITLSRVEAALDVLEINYGTDEDGDLFAGFEGNPCWFRVSGPGTDAIAFSFNARWKAWLDGEQLGPALAAVNEWNASQLFPRALCVQDESGELVLGADYTSDHEFGVTDLQLRNDITIAVTTAINYFQFLNERFPGAEEASAAALADAAADHESRPDAE